MQQNATQQTQHNGSHHNATQCNTTQQNSPQNNKTGNKNRAHVLDKPVEVTSSSTKHSTEKKNGQKHCKYNGRSCVAQPHGWLETQEPYENQMVVTKCHSPLHHS